MTSGLLAGAGSERTVTRMAAKRRSPIVAMFEIVSDLLEAGEAYRHVVEVAQSGRVRSVVDCGERVTTVDEWHGAEPPTVEDLTALLLGACRDDYHASRVRLLSAVVHGLLPQGNHLGKEWVEIPDAVLDASLGFGPRTSYRAEIRRALVDVLKVNPKTAWAMQVQSAGTDEHAEFAQQIAESGRLDPVWLARSLQASRDGSGTPFGDLVTRAASSSTFLLDLRQPRAVAGDVDDRHDGAGLRRTGKRPQR